MYHSRNSPVSLSPILFGSYPLCSALSMITGNALEYFKAFAKCWPPHPVPAVFCGLSLTRLYSIKHCLSRIMLGMLMIMGTIYCPPHPLSGLSVEDFPDERNMHNETKRSPSTLEYEVRTSASKMSPNFPS